MKAILGTLMLLGACKLPTKTESDIRIVGGVPVEESHPAYRSAVALAERDSAGVSTVFCSGVLVAEDLVVTAAHCLNRDLRDLRVLFGAPHKAELRPVVAVQTFRDNYLNGKRLFPVFDIGWVKFDGGLPKDAAPATILPDTAALTPGLVYSMAGYGDTATNRRDAGENKLRTESTLTWYKEHPQVPGLMLYGPTPGKGSCAADSGGPGYVRVNGSWYLAGVNNGKPGHFIGMDQANCEDGIGVQTSVTYYKAWIEESAGVKLPGPSRPTMASSWPVKVPAHTSFQAWCEDSNLPRAFFEFLQDAADVLNILPSDCAELEKALGRRDDFHLAVSPELLPLLKTIKGGRRLTVSLDAPGGEFAVLDANDLAGFSGLEQLTLYMNGGTLKNQDGLAKLSSLQQLTVRDAANLDPDVLAKLVTLREVHLAGLTVRDLSFTKAMTNLTILDVSLSNLRDVSALAGRATLQQLELDQNDIVDVTPLGSLTSLTSLSLNNNGIKDVRSLAALTNLTTLDLSSNAITDVSVLKGLKKLRTLYLSANPIKDKTCPVPDIGGTRVCLF